MARRRLVIGAVSLLGLLLVCGTVLWQTRSKEISARVVVLDNSGVPVAGAVITPDGLRHKGPSSGHYLWTEKYDRGIKPRSVTTDELGRARIVYPRYVDEKLETREVSFSVSHPDFPAERPFIIVDPTPPAKEGLWGKLQAFGISAYRMISGRETHAIHLKAPATIVLKGTLQGQDAGTNLFALCSSLSWAGKDSWRPAGASGIFSRNVAPGENLVLVYHRSGEGMDHFSEPLEFKAAAGQTNEFKVELQPGVHATGRLSTNVPRPVSNGMVIARRRFGGNVGLFWASWAEIKEDGSFALPAMPAGELLLVAMCDGFVSASPGPGSSTRPQRFPLMESNSDIVLEMEPTATAEIFVTGPDQKPLEGVTIGFSPNVQWGNAATILMSDAYDSRSIFVSEKRSVQESPWKFWAVSGVDGIASVPNLPAYCRSFGASHDEFELPIRKNAAGTRDTRGEVITLRSGEVSRVSIRMQKKGEEFLE